MECGALSLLFIFNNWYAGRFRCLNLCVCVRVYVCVPDYGEYEINNIDLQKCRSVE